MQGDNFAAAQGRAEFHTQTRVIAGEVGLEGLESLAAQELFHELLGQGVGLAFPHHMNRDFILVGCGHGRGNLPATDVRGNHDHPPPSATGLFPGLAPLDGYLELSVLRELLVALGDAPRKGVHRLVGPPGGRPPPEFWIDQAQVGAQGAPHIGEGQEETTAPDPDHGRQKPSRQAVRGPKVKAIPKSAVEVERAQQALQAAGRRCLGDAPGRCQEPPSAMARMTARAMRKLSQRGR